MPIHARRDSLVWMETRHVLIAILGHLRVQAEPPSALSVVGGPFKRLLVQRDAHYVVMGSTFLPQGQLNVTGAILEPMPVLVARVLVNIALRVTSPLLVGAQNAVLVTRVSMLELQDNLFA